MPRYSRVGDAAQVTALGPLATTSLPGGTSTFLRADGTFGAAGGGVAPALKVPLGWKTPLVVNGAAGSNTFTVNRMYATPLVLWTSETWDRIGTRSITGAASSVVRLGVYADNGTGYPGALIADFGTIDTSVSGTDQTITINQAMSAGLVWIVAVCQGGTPSISGATQQQSFFYHWVGSATPFTFNTFNGFFQDSVSGALPANFTTTVGANGNAFPKLWVRTT